MANEKRVTKADRFNELLTLIPSDRSDLIEFINHELDLLTRKNSGEKKPTKSAQEHADLMAKVLEQMPIGEAHTVTEWQGIIPEIALANGVSNQKASRILNDLEKAGKVVKEPDKRKMTFRKV